MKNLLLITALLCTLISCQEKETLPSYIVYGDPNEPMVFNLQIIDSEIGIKDVKAEGNQSGTVRLINNLFIIYEPGTNFTNDQVNVLSDGNVIAGITFISKNLNSACVPFARSYKFQIKNTETINQTVFYDFCNVSTANTTSISEYIISPANGFIFSNSGGLIGFTFTPEPGSSRIVEFICNIASHRPGAIKNFYDAEVYLSALVQIEVTN